tara:strand:- start:263 stop:985 length:723 start_codon:yes stop_codon:yes gene_type:complete
MSQGPRVPRRRKTIGDSQSLFSALILVLVLASLVGMYFYIEDKNSQNNDKVAMLEKKIESIENVILVTDEDSDLNISKVNEKISDLNEKIDIIEDQMSQLEFENRKLWDHRPDYLKRFDKQDANIEKLDADIDKNSDQIINLADSTADLQINIDSLDQKIQLAEDLQLKITLLTNDVNNQKKLIDENTTSLDAIDQYRIQNNQKISDILNRLNSLAFEFDELKNDLEILKSEISKEENIE